MLEIYKSLSLQSLFLQSSLKRDVSEKWPNLYNGEAELLENYDYATRVDNVGMEKVNDVSKISLVDVSCDHETRNMNQHRTRPISGHSGEIS